MREVKWDIKKERERRKRERGKEGERSDRDCVNDNVLRKLNAADQHLNRVRLTEHDSGRKRKKKMKWKKQYK